MKKALSLYYKHENDALRSTSESYRAALLTLGYETLILDLSDLNSLPELDRLLKTGEIDFCFSVQGIGSTLETTDKTNLWAARRTPFICIHHDNPCYNPFNHMSDSPYVANMYFFESFLDIKQRYLPSNQVSVATPFKLPSTWTPRIDNIDYYSARPIRLLYAKTGGRLDELNTYIDSLPAGVRDGIRQGLEVAHESPNLQLCDLVDKMFISLGFDRSKQEQQFWGVVQTMDDFIRRKRSIDFVNWLKYQEGALIVGDGWDFIDRIGTRAIFMPSISMHKIYQLYLQAIFACNTNPYGRDIIHERVLQGLMSENIVLSDTNEWMDKTLGHIPALKRFDWTLSLDDQLKPVLHDPKITEYKQSGSQAAYDIFVKDATAQPLIDLAEKVRQFAKG